MAVTKPSQREAASCRGSVRSGRLSVHSTRPAHQDIMNFQLRRPLVSDKEFHSSWEERMGKTTGGIFTHLLPAHYNAILMSFSLGWLFTVIGSENLDCTECIVKWSRTRWQQKIDPGVPHGWNWTKKWDFGGVSSEKNSRSLYQMRIAGL